MTNYFKTIRKFNKKKWHYNKSNKIILSKYNQLFFHIDIE
jgi:hypothetical protein